MQELLLMLDIYSATHNPNVTDMGKQQARGRLESMGEHPQQPGD